MASATRPIRGLRHDRITRRPKAMGVARVYTLKDVELNTIMFDIVALADPRAVAAE